MANNTSTANETPWYENLWNWLGNTASTALETSMKGKQAKYEADLLAQQQQDNNTLNFFGKELHKDTIMWIFGGTLLTVLVLVLARRR